MVTARGYVFESGSTGISAVAKACLHAYVEIIKIDTAASDVVTSETEFSINEVSVPENKLLRCAIFLL